MNTLILSFSSTLKMSDEWVNLLEWLHVKRGIESIEEYPKLWMACYQRPLLNGDFCM